MDAPLIQASLLFVGVGVLGALLPLVRTWSDRSLHVLVSVSAGVFLGTLFLELLPRLALPEGSAVDPRLPWVATLAGMLVLFFLERTWVRERFGGEGTHLVVWLGTFTGLSIHAFVGGMGLATLLGGGELPLGLVVPLSIHKAAEAFSLATVMRLAEVPIGRSRLWLGLFLLTTPVGLLLGSHLSSGAAGSPAATLVLQGLAAGTFLHVAAYDLMPEVFHGRQQRLLRIGGLLLGLTVFAIGTH